MSTGPLLEAERDAVLARPGKVAPHSHRLIVDDFTELGNDLRSFFDNRMMGSLTVSPPPKDRFVWDYWHVPGRYTYLRTPAAEFFEKSLLDAFYKRLLDWGLETLGTRSSDGLWLSYYVHGCRQEIHHDRGNGEWAFVYSLTRWEGHPFQGGQTLLAKPNLHSFSSWQQADDLTPDATFEEIEPRFGRLLVFDSRIPHGVRPVEGTFNPMQGRVVLHSWLRASGVHVRGSLTKEQVARTLEPAVERLGVRMSRFEGVDGLLTARLRVDAAGQVEEVRFLTNTLCLTDEGGTPTPVVTRAVERLLKGLSFVPTEGETAITLPIDLS